MDQPDWERLRREFRRRHRPVDRTDTALVALAVVLLGAAAYLVLGPALHGPRGTVSVEVTAPAGGGGTATPAGSDLALGPGIAGSHVAGETMIVSGSATPGSRVDIGAASTLADPRGAWQLQVALVPGRNEFTLASLTPDGGRSSLTFSVVDDAPVVASTTAPTSATTAAASSGAAPSSLAPVEPRATSKPPPRFTPLRPTTTPPPTTATVVTSAPGAVPPDGEPKP